MTALLMQGFPPAEGGQVTLANWRTSPFNHWAFHHVREIVPSAEIANDPGNVRDLPTAPADLEAIAFNAGEGARTTFGQFLDASDTDGIVVIHRGRIVLERYGNGMTARTPHILMSVSKSMLGLLAGILAGRKILDLDKPVTAYVPEVAETAYRGASVRQLLDMRVGVAFDEDYLATSGPIIAYRKSTNWNPLAPGETASDLRSFYKHLTGSDGEHGGRFHYVSPNTDLLGWVIERAAGARYADLMSELLWQPMGAATSAYITVDRLGAPRCAGGMCTTTRDLALVGQLLIEGGARGGRTIVPESWIADITLAGSPSAWRQGSFLGYYPDIDMHYRAKWYVERGPRPLLFGMGIHGQNLFVDPRAELVIAKQSSQALPIDPSMIALTSRAVNAMREEMQGN